MQTAPTSRFRLLRRALAFATAAAAVGCNFQTQFAVVREGVLLRGCQPREGDLDWVRDTHGVKTIIALETKNYGSWQPMLDQLATDEREWCRANGVRLFELPLQPGHPPEEYLRLFFSLIDDPSARPVFVHCYGGLERAAALVAAYRIRYEGWTPDQCIAEMNRFSYFEPFWPRQARFVRALPELLPKMGFPPTDLSGASASRGGSGGVR